MQPGRRLPMRCRPTCCAMKNDPFRLTDITSSHSSRVMSRALRRSVTAALLTRVSTRPKALTTSAVARSMPGCERTSSSTGTPRAPAAWIRPSVSDSFSTRREDTATSQPSRASATAMAAPSPCDAPVTNATGLDLLPPVTGHRSLVTDYAERFHCPRPQRVLVPHELREFLRRLAGQDDGAAQGEALDHPRVGQHRCHRLEHPVHHRLRRSRGEVHPLPRADSELGETRFRERGHIGQLRDARGRNHRKYP